MDDSIYFKEADKEGAHWKEYPKLKRALEKIANKAHQAGTRDFRHGWSHRFSPRIVFGYTQAVSRTVHGDKVIYAVGGIPPMPLASVVEALQRECEKSYEAFDKFRTLVGEHIEAIHASLPEVPAVAEEAHDS
jgi:hypothetical protein